jgi:HSP20 family molecular chaperone IbpA
VLVVEGERPAPAIPEPQGVVGMHLMEIDHGRFLRAIEVPPRADVDAIEASYRGGLLWIRIPKQA